jgi:hypothetical protein
MDQSQGGQGTARALPMRIVLLFEVSKNTPNGSSILSSRLHQVLEAPFLLHLVH